ncbi:hypothetical protein LTR78_008638 [Recurvomyces mirabilis]|uniref:RRM domain-containing protein n=1 Tax=Recurvomyces mirabilis TaxID=574656 RepID=A0AAE0TT00_9PEZI|nr:hypothetical protein LTR78_008638 [Recurvomyces mirabilis]KAK5153451.1 hypothetical protein LTS14_007621 [Recurvomyces mirabilis]
MAEANAHEYGPVIASSNRYLDIEPYCGRIYNTEYHTWRDVLPREFPQSATKEVEEAFLKHYFTEREIYIQGGDPGGYRFLKQVWYCIALWNYQIKIPKVADEWMTAHENIITSTALRSHLLSPKAEVSAFFFPPDVYTYGEKLLGQVIGLIQYRVMQLTADVHPWHAASGSRTTTESTSPSAQAALANPTTAKHIDVAVSEPPSESSSTSRSSRKQQAGLVVANRPVASLSPVPEDIHRPRAESSTQPQLPPVQVRKRGNSFSRVQQNTTRSSSFMPRSQQQYPHVDMQYAQQPPPFNSAGPTSGNLHPHMAQQHGRLSSDEHAHPIPKSPHFIQGHAAVPGSAAPPHVSQQIGPYVDLVNGPPPPSDYLPPKVEPRRFGHAGDEQYFGHRYDEGRFSVQAPLDDKRGTIRYANNRRDSYPTRGGKPRTFSVSRGKPYSGRNSFSSGSRNSEAFIQASDDARYTATFVSEDKSRRNSNFSNDWRAKAPGDWLPSGENLPPSREGFTYGQSGMPSHQSSGGFKGNTAGQSPYMPTPVYAPLPTQQEFEAPGPEGQQYIEHESELGYDPGANTPYTIAPGCTYIAKLLVFYVPPQMTEADVHQYFQAIGPVKLVSLGPNQLNTAPRNMWITFRNHTTTVKALALNGTHWPSSNQRLRIEVPREYWDPSHHKFPGSDHPENRRHVFKSSRDLEKHYGPHPQPKHPSQDARNLKYVADVQTPTIKSTNVPNLTKDVLSGASTIVASGPSTPKKKSKPKKSKGREPPENAPASIAKSKAASEETITTEHVGTIKEGIVIDTTPKPYAAHTSTDLAKDTTSAQVNAHSLEGKDELGAEYGESQAKQAEDMTSVPSVTNPVTSEESQGADGSAQQPFRAQTPAEAKATVSGSASTESAQPTTAISLDSNEKTTKSSSGADGTKDVQLIMKSSDSTASVTASSPVATPAATQKHDDDGVDESFHTAIESNESAKQQKIAEQKSRPESTTAEPAHTTDVPHHLLSINSRTEDRGTDETTSSAVTAITTIRTPLEISHDPKPVATEQTEPIPAEYIPVASLGSQTPGSQARSPASTTGKKVPIPLLMVNKTNSNRTNDDASPKIDNPVTPTSVNSPSSPTTPAATMASPKQQARKDSSAALSLPSTQTKVDKSKGPAKTESLSMFAKKQQTSKSKKSKPQKGKGSIRDKSLFDNDGVSSTASPSESRAASIAADTFPQDVLDQDFMGGDRASIDTVMESADTQSTGPVDNSTLQSAQGVGGLPRQRPDLQSRKQTNTMPVESADNESSATRSPQQSSNKSPGPESDPNQSRSADIAKGAVSSTDGSPSSSGASAPAATTGSEGSDQTLFRSFRESDASLGVRDSGDSGGAIPDPTGGNGTVLDPAIPGAGMTEDKHPPADEVPSEEKAKKKSRKSGNKKKKGKSKADNDQEESQQPTEQDSAQQSTVTVAETRATTACSSATTPAPITLIQAPGFMFKFGLDKTTPSTPFANKTSTVLSSSEDHTTLSPTAASATSSHTFGRPSDTSGDNTPPSTAAASSSADSPSSRVQSLIAARQQQLQKKGGSGLVTAPVNRGMMAKRQHAHRKRATKSSDSSTSSSAEGERQAKEKDEGEGEGEGDVVVVGGEAETMTSGRRPSGRSALLLRSAGLGGIGIEDSVFDARRTFRGSGGPGTLLIYIADGSHDGDGSGNGKEAEKDDDDEGWTGIVEDGDEEDTKKL